MMSRFGQMDVLCQDIAEAALKVGYLINPDDIGVGETPAGTLADINLGTKTVEAIGTDPINALKKLREQFEEKARLRKERDEKKTSM